MHILKRQPAPTIANSHAVMIEFPFHLSCNRFADEIRVKVNRHVIVIVYRIVSYRSIVSIALSYPIHFAIGEVFSLFAYMKYDADICNFNLHRIYICMNINGTLAFCVHNV